MKSDFRILNPRLDTNFKAIFTQNTKDSKIALKSFLSAAIGQEVRDVTVIENENPKEFNFQHGLRYDINCVFKDGTSAQIEMQGQEDEYDYGKRAEYYLSRLVSSAINIGDDWEKLPKAYQISVLNFKYDKSTDEAVHHYIMCDKKDDAKLSGTLNVIFLELPKIPEISDFKNIENLPSIIKWCKFLQEADNPQKQDLINELTKSEVGIMSAETTLKGISMDRWRWIIQGQIEGRERDELTAQNIAKRRKKEIEALEKKLSVTNTMLSDAESKLTDTESKLTDAKSKLSDVESKLQTEKNRTFLSIKNLLQIGSFSDEQIAEIFSVPLEQVLAIKNHTPF
ncbi:MAG: Rpn family recombination-promoting nuclease/putative transposase [Treponema sp.]|uniref:Rpn family recombination-promoting nuclease/putative transposase n=1 Tax=Treponema sp. TaxID=166 RepID=UPI0025CBE477|nr:Rpn family recombination-promoting nuclease/putative transposase [Treponema sp.]MBQ9282214.1 Rpn family recombination-promoting nuclease/putative transposase [Treponema sp.]